MLNTQAAICRTKFLEHFSILKIVLLIWKQVWQLQNGTSNKVWFSQTFWVYIKKHSEDTSRDKKLEEDQNDAAFQLRELSCS